MIVRMYLAGLVQYRDSREEDPSWGRAAQVDGLHVFTVLKAARVCLRVS